MAGASLSCAQANRVSVSSRVESGDVTTTSSPPSTQKELPLPAPESSCPQSRRKEDRLVCHHISRTVCLPRPRPSSSAYMRERSSWRSRLIRCALCPATTTAMRQQPEPSLFCSQPSSEWIGGLAQAPCALEVSRCTFFLRNQLPRVPDGGGN